jgi:hypothetical protein
MDISLEFFFEVEMVLIIQHLHHLKSLFGFFDDFDRWIGIVFVHGDEFEFGFEGFVIRIEWGSAQT